MFLLVFVLSMNLFTSTLPLIGAAVPPEDEKQNQIEEEDEEDEYGLTRWNYFTQVGKNFMVKAPKILDRFVVLGGRVSYSVCERNEAQAQIARVKLNRENKEKHIWVLSDLVFTNKYMESRYESYRVVMKDYYDHDIEEVCHLILYDFLMKTASIDLNTKIKWENGLWRWDEKKYLVVRCSE
jgi:hypothetical protein